MLHETLFGDSDRDVANGALSLLLNQQLGSGGSRVVYRINGQPERVIKLESNPHLCQNIIEYELYGQWAETKEAKRWLAECFDSSYNGRALIQERLSIITDPNDPRLPAKIPRFLTDLKISNWGVSKDGQVKCCDYGVALLMQGNPWQLVKANWWNLD